MDINGSIIVYRNPLEQQFWEGGYIIPIGAGCFIGLVVFLSVYNLTHIILKQRWMMKYSQRNTWNWNNSIATYIGGFFGVWAGIMTVIWTLQ